MDSMVSDKMISLASRSQLQKLSSPDHEVPPPTSEEVMQDIAKESWFGPTGGEEAVKVLDLRRKQNS
jgi:hypothetical protein